MITESQSFPNYVFLIGVKTDVGRSRKHNEDFVGYHHPKDPQQQAAYGTLMVVCDGVGGAAAGEIASETAVRKIIDAYYSLPAKMTVQDRLIEAIQQANEVIYGLNQQRDREMATTVVAAVILDKHLVVAHAGDSRAYLVRGGKIAQLTQDHSWVEEMVRSGDLTPEEARRHPWRNRITRGLGMNPNVKVEINIYDWLPGDTLVLCSDGLTRHVNDDEIAAVVMNHLPHEAVERLIDLANQRGGKDNISAIVARSAPESLVAGAVMPEEETEPTFVPPPQIEKASVSKNNLRQHKIILLSVAILAVLMCLTGSGLALVRIFQGGATPTLIAASNPGQTTPSPLASMTAHKKADTPIMTPQPTNTPVGSSVKVETSPETITPSVSPTAPPTQPSAPTASPTNVVEDTPTVTPTPQPTPMSAPTLQNYAIVVPQIGAKLRPKRNETNVELGSLALGSRVQLLEPCEFTEQDWCHVKANIYGEEKVGWTRGDLLLKPQFSISSSSEGYPIQFSLPISLTAWDIRFLSDDQLLLATTHQTKKTPLLFQLPNSNTQQDQLLPSKDQVIVLGFPNLTEFIPDEFTIRQAALAPNGNKFGLLQEDGTSILVWDVETREKQPKCKAGGTVLTFAFGPKGGRVACSAAEYGTILEGVNKDGRWLPSEKPPEKSSLVNLAVALRPTERHPESDRGFNVIAGVTAARDAYYVYRQGPNALALLNQPIQADQAHVDAFSRIALDAHADWLAIGARDAQGPLVLAAHWTNGGEGFNAPTTFLDDKTQQLQGEIVAMAFSPDGAMIAAGTSNGDVMAARMEGFKVVNIWHVDDEVKALAFSPDNQYLAVLTENRLHIYELPSD